MIRIAENFHFSLFMGFMIQNLSLHALPFWFLHSLPSGGGACNGVVWSVASWIRGMWCGRMMWCMWVWGVVSWGSSSFLSMSVFCYPVIGWCLWETSSGEEWLIAHWCLLGRIRTQRGSGGDGGRSWFPEAGRWWVLLSQLGLALCSAGK